MEFLILNFAVLKHLRGREEGYRLLKGGGDGKGLCLFRVGGGGVGGDNLLIKSVIKVQLHIIVKIHKVKEVESQDYEVPLLLTMVKEFK